jgi:hypothetical protein
MVNSCESDYSCDGISLIMSLSIRRGASAYMSVLIWEHFAPHRSLDVMKFTAPPPLPLILACKLSFPVGLKISYLLNSALKSLTEYIYGRPASDIDQIPTLIPHRNSP